MSTFDHARSLEVAGDWSSHAEVRAAFDSLAVPPGALGRLVEPVARMALSQGSTLPTAGPAAGVIFVADHGIALDDVVTPWPQTITRTMADLAARGRAACSAIAGSVGAELVVVDVGIATGPTPTGVLDHRVRDGSHDVRRGPGLDPGDVASALDVGARVAHDLHARGVRVAAVGEIGIGNTTAAAALISLLTDVDPARITGRGSGIDDVTLDRKRDVVADLVRRCGGLPIHDVLAEVGALDVCALAGFMVSSGSCRVPIVLDGVTTVAAALVARTAAPWIVDHLIAGHRSPEPAVDVGLQALGLAPMVDFEMRVGEGTGALLALPLLAAGCALIRDVARLDEVTPQ